MIYRVSVFFFFSKGSVPLCDRIYYRVTHVWSVRRTIVTVAQKWTAIKFQHDLLCLHKSGKPVSRVTGLAFTRVDFDKVLLCDTELD